MKSLIFLLLALNTSCAGKSPATREHEPRVKVAIIDTGFFPNDRELKPFLCREKPYDPTDTNSVDTNGHGTNIASTIVRGLDPTKVCIIPIKYYLPGSSTNPNRMWTALFYVASRPDIKYVNLSSGGNGFKPVEKKHIKTILANKTYFVTCAGNEATNLNKDCNYYPACYAFLSPYFHVVGNGEDERSKGMMSNYGSPPVTDWMPGYACAGHYPNGHEICMQGTSQATALYTNKLIKYHLEKGAPWFSIKSGGIK